MYWHDYATYLAFCHISIYLKRINSPLDIQGNWMNLNKMSHYVTAQCCCFINLLSQLSFFSLLLLPFILFLFFKFWLLFLRGGNYDYFL